MNRVRERIIPKNSKFFFTDFSFNAYHLIVDSMILEAIYITLLFFAMFFIALHLNLWFDNKDKMILRVGPKAARITTLPSISLIIPAYNEEAVIEKTLEKIKEADYPKSRIEVIVVDDGSKDRTCEIAKKTKKRLGLNWVKILTKANSGKASALNFGLKKAKNELVAVMDADSFFEKNALKNCVKHFAESDVAAVTSHILCSEKNTFWERMQNIELMIISVTRKLEEYINVIQATPGPLSIYRKNVLDKLGGFDEKNLVEDVEIAWRILKNGYKIKMAFDAFTYSLYPSSLKRWWMQRVRWTIGGLQTLAKYKSSIGLKNHMVGTFVVPTSFLGYSATIIGLGIFLYLFMVRTFNSLVYFYRAFSIGLNPFLRWEFTYYVDLKIILGFFVLAFALYLFKISLSLHKWKINWRDIPVFLFLYPMLYLFVNLHGIYKYCRKDIGWFTK